MNSRRRMGAAKFSDWVVDGGPPPLAGQSVSTTRHTVSSHVPNVPFPRLMAGTVLNVDSLSAPQLSIDVGWDGTLKTLQREASQYVGPDTNIVAWLEKTFGRAPKQAMSYMMRGSVRFEDGKIKYHDVVTLAREWDRKRQCWRQLVIEYRLFADTTIRIYRVAN